MLIVNSPDKSRPASAGLFNWHRNSTNSIMDFSKNDVLLGSQDPFFWFLLPLFGFVSAGVAVLVNYATLAVIHILCFIYSMLTAKPAWIRNDDRRYLLECFNHSGTCFNLYSKRNAPASFSVSSPRRRFITTGVLLLLVSTLIPYQFAYMVACIVQIATCTRALRLAKENVRQCGLWVQYCEY